MAQVARLNHHLLAHVLLLAVPMVMRRTAQPFVARIALDAVRFSAHLREVLGGWQIPRPSDTRRRSGSGGGAGNSTYCTTASAHVHVLSIAKLLSPCHVASDLATREQSVIAVRDAKHWPKRAPAKGKESDVQGCGTASGCTAVWRPNRL